MAEVELTSKVNWFELFQDNSEIPEFLCFFFIYLFFFLFHVQETWSLLLGIDLFLRANFTIERTDYTIFPNGFVCE